MSDQFVGEIRMVGFNFAPVGWQLCNGQVLSISQNAALFALLGTQFGGNGTSTFGLPNLQGRLPMHQGTGGGGTYVMGEVGGNSSVSILISNMPIHNHALNVDGNASGKNTPVGNFCGTVAAGAADKTYGPGPASGTMAATVIGNQGGNIPLAILPPFQVVNFIIATVGLFPSRN